MKRAHRLNIFDGFSDDEAGPTKKTTKKQKSSHSHSHESPHTLKQRIEALESQKSELEVQLKESTECNAKLEDGANKLVMNLGMTIVAGEALDQGMLNLGCSLRKLRRALKEQLNRVTEDSDDSIPDFFKACQSEIKVAVKSAGELRRFAQTQLEQQPHLLKLCLEHEEDDQSGVFSTPHALTKFVDGVRAAAKSKQGSVLEFYEHFAKAITEAEKSPDRESTTPPTGSIHSDGSSA